MSRDNLTEIKLFQSVCLLPAISCDMLWGVCADIRLVDSCRMPSVVLSLKALKERTKAILSESNMLSPSTGMLGGWETTHALFRLVHVCPPAWGWPCSKCCHRSPQTWAQPRHAGLDWSRELPRVEQQPADVCTRRYTHVQKCRLNSYPSD